MHAGQDPARARPEHEELRYHAGPDRRVAAEHHPVVPAGLDPAGVLHAQVVLVGEEVRQPVVAHRLAEHRAGGRLAAVQRVGPVLHPDPLTQQRMRDAGHVAGRVDVRIAGAQARVDGDTVVEDQTRRLGELHHRRDPDADHGQVGRQLGAVVEDHRAQPAAGAAELPYPRAETERHPVRAVQVGEDLGHLVAEHPAQRRAVHLHDGHLGAVAARRGRGLQADPAGADDHDASGVAESGQERVGVRKGSQITDAVQVRARCVEAARPGSGGQQQLVVAQRIVPFERDGVPGGIQPRRPHAEHQFHVVRGVPVRVVYVRLVPRVGAHQVPLGQWRPFVGPLGLLADQHDPAVEPGGPQFLGGLRSGE